MQKEEKNSVKQDQIHDLLFNRELGWQEIIHDLINTEQLDAWDIDIVILADKYLETTYNYMKRAYDRMKEVDRLGSFESDDESGFIFQEIKSAIEELNETFELDAKEEKE